MKQSILAVIILGSMAVFLLGGAYFAIKYWKDLFQNNPEDKQDE